MQRLVKSFDALLQEAGFGENYNGDAYIRDMGEQLMKAITNSGYLEGTAPAADATSLRLQNLDATMTSVLFTEEYLKIFKSLPRVPSIQPFFEWNRRLSYGGGRTSAGFGEGGIPKGGVSSWARFNATVRFMGVKGGITHQALTTGMLGGMQISPVEEENRNRTLELLEKIERGMLFNLAAILDESGNTVNYDGILQQMDALSLISSVAPNNVIDLQGGPLLPETLENMSEYLYSTAWIGSLDRYISFQTPGTLSDFSKLRNGTGVTPASLERFFRDGGQTQYIDGLPFNGYQSNFGTIRFEPSLFMERVKLGRPLLAANEIAAITVADVGSPASPPAPVGTPGTNAAALIPTGSYYYVASAFNDSGESLGVVSASASTPTKPQQVSLVITRVTGATGYRIYRTNGGTSAKDINGVNARWIADVPQPGSGNATYVDTNQIVPGTGLFVFIRPDVEDIVIAQMSPLIKFPLAVVSTTIEFIYMLYHTMAIKAPERHFVIKNIGRLQGENFN